MTVAVAQSAAKLYSIVVFLFGFLLTLVGFAVVLRGTSHGIPSPLLYLIPGFSYLGLGVFIWRRRIWAMIAAFAFPVPLWPMLWEVFTRPNLLSWPMSWYAIVALVVLLIFGLLTVVYLVTAIRAKAT